MHKLILTGIAALMVLALATGGRAEPMAARHADATLRSTSHSVVAMTDTASWWR